MAQRVSRHQGAVIVAALGTLICGLPLSLTGALAVQLTSDLVFGLAQLGLAIATFRGVHAITATYMGVLADRLGARRSLRYAVAGSATSCLGIGIAATNWWTLVLWLAVGALARSLCQPAANRLIANAVDKSRQGLAFGIKQAAAPATSAIGGLSVPIIALTIGWEWAYIFVAVLAFVVMVSVRRPANPVPVRQTVRKKLPPLRDKKTIATLMLAFGFGNAAASTVPAFFVDSAVRAGVTIQMAGYLLAFGSTAAIATRVLSGMAADRMATGHVRLCAGLLTSGALGLGLLAIGRPATMTVGVALALSGTWGFNAVFWYALMQAYPEAPGRVTGAVAPGGLLGGVTGPIVVGFLAENVSYRLGWTLAAVSSLLSAVGMVYGARRLARMSISQRE